MRPVIQSYKKVLDIPLTTQPTSTVPVTMVLGEDSVAAGQTSATDPDVPTGSVIKYIEIMYSCVNLVAVAMSHHICIQYVLSGQSAIAPDAVGGNAQRNQVLLEALMVMGKDQNNNRKFKFRIPKKYQRIREGTKWIFTTKGSAVYTDAIKIIYKFYR